ncbi:MAG: YigZ family protein [Candidatus Caldatribacteriota bacterium]|nr:YigZ family protein [Candidatus Caldatribacteriota bacterium]
MNHYFKQKDESMTNKNNFMTISHEVQVKNAVKKSRFYSSVKEIEKEEGIREFLKELKKQFPDASHHCWAYKIGINEQQIKQYSDAGEPANSAGPPILQAIEHEGLTNVMVIVTRYFGGIKLGIGGLIRAYRESALQGLQSAGRVEKFALREFTLQGINYDELGPIIQAIESREGRIANIKYDKNITIITHLSESMQKWLSNMAKNFSHGRVTIKFGKVKWYKKN